MAKIGGHKQKHIFSEINITPLTDIFLVLLTIMMLVAPVMRQMQADIKLPQIVSGTDTGKDELTVDVTRDGVCLIEGNEVPQDNLTQILQSKASNLAAKKLNVHADKEAKSGIVLKVFQAAEEAKFEKVTVVGEALEPPKEKNPDESR